MLHHVSLGEWDGPTRLERHDIDMHVVCEIVWVHESGGGPGTVRARHLSRNDILISSDERTRDMPVEGFVGFADPLERCVGTALVSHRPGGAGGKIGVGAGFELVRRSFDADGQSATGEKEYALDARLRLGGVAAATGRHLNDELRERGRESGDRARQDP